MICFTELNFPPLRLFFTYPVLLKKCFNCLLRGKCNVTLLNETDVLAGYLEKEVRHNLMIYYEHIALQYFKLQKEGS